MLENMEGTFRTGDSKGLIMINQCNLASGSYYWTKTSFSPSQCDSLLNTFLALAHNCLRMPRLLNFFGGPQSVVFIAHDLVGIRQ